MQTITPLMTHQATAIAKMLPSRVGALFAEMGTGKTLMAIELAAIRQQKWDRLFWFCPVSLKETISQQFRQHTDITASQIKVWDDRVSSHHLPSSALIHVIGIESMSASGRTLLAYNALVTDRSFVIVDESSYIKGYASNRTMRITALSANSRYRLILTGTPFTQGIADLYAQMTFLSQKILGYSSFYSFAANHLEYEYKINNRGFRARTGRIVRAHNTDYLAAKIAPYIYQVRKDECLDLPEKLYETRYFPMTREQQERYIQAKEEILLNLAYDDWSSIAIFQLFTALQAIVCGFWTRTDPATKAVEHVTCNHDRIAMLLDVIARIPSEEPIIIWAKYRYAVQQIKQALDRVYGAAAYAEFHGGYTATQRQQELQRWQSGGARILIATQSSGGHGLTLNRASYALFYANGYKYSERIQSEDRNHRIGTTRRPTYISLCCSNSIDDKITAALARKENALSLFRQRVTRYHKDDLKAQAIKLVREL